MELGTQPVDRRQYQRARLLRTASVVVLAVCVLIQAAALAKYAQDQEYLKALMSSLASPSIPASQQAEAISKYLALKPDDSNNAYFLLPIFGVLRPSARAVADQGGDCADRSRLMVVLLETRHIHASKWALYTPSGQPHHAVVELRSEAGNMVIDPLYNMWFPKPGGGFYDIDDLRADPSILRNRVLTLQADTADQLNKRIDWYPLDQYVYNNARRINWNKSIILLAVYRVLHAVIGARADHIWRPEYAEQPALMIVYGFLPLDGVALFALAWAGRKRKRAAERESVPVGFKTERTSSY